MQSRHTKPPVFSRHYIVLTVLVLTAVGMIMRAAYLQLVNKDFLQERGNERYLRVVKIPAHRGMIMDRNGEPLAVSSPVDSIWVHPKSVLQQQNHLPVLAQALGMSTATLQQLLIHRRNRQFVYLRRHLTPHRAKQVMALQIPGVHSQREYRRYYPTAEVTSHLLGSTNIDDIGQEGIEYAFNDWLQGTSGSKRVIQDRLGRIVEDVESLRVPVPGKPIILSIDRRIQYLAYRALKAATLEHNASGASAVVLDVTTGEILSMVNQPAGNPNDRHQLRPALLRNRAVTDVYEPGSTLKPFAIAMALESGAYQADTPVDTTPGYLRVGRRLVRDIHNYGLIDVTRVVVKSSNVGVSKIALSLSAEQLWSLYAQLGFGKITGVGFPGERSGVLRHFSDWSLIGHANHAFGYGLAVTTLQLAQAYAILAADGIRRPLSLLRLDKPPKKAVRLLSASTTRQLRRMLEAVVSREGTGLKALVSGYRVAGKTGTIRKIVEGKYTRDHYISLFAGMAPASQPRLVVVVMIDDSQRGGYYGGTVAAPVFSSIMGGALRVLNVTPDALSTTGFTMTAVQGEQR